MARYSYLISGELSCVLLYLIGEQDSLIMQVRVKRELSLPTPLNHENEMLPVLGHYGVDEMRDGAGHASKKVRSAAVPFIILPSAHI